MYIEQIYTGCLNEAAYFVESNGEAVVIDPLRDINDYLALAKKHKAQIRYIFETHLHSDFVSGHLDLSKKTGATIVFGPTTEARFAFHKAKEGEIFKVGNITIEAIHTPGHTLESTSYLLKDEAGRPYCLFAGDMLFSGDIGRPDLSIGHLPREELTAMLFHSLQNKTLSLPEEVILYPAHVFKDPISSKEKTATLGLEKKENAALQPLTPEAFVNLINSGQQSIPAYFKIIANKNKDGYSPLEAVLTESLVPLDINAFTLKMEDHILLDTRSSNEFTGGFVPGSISIGLDGKFEEWAGTLLSFDRPVLLITEAGNEKESVVRLARVGFESVRGYLDGGFEKWKESGKKIDLVIDIEADELAMDIPFDDNLKLLDVRKEAEFLEAHVREAVNLPLNEMTDIAQIADIEEEQNVYVHSNHGYRSVIAASLLKKQGYHNLRNVLGGFSSIKDHPTIELEEIPE